MRIFFLATALPSPTTCTSRRLGARGLWFFFFSNSLLRLTGLFSVFPIRKVLFKSFGRSRTESLISSNYIPQQRTPAACCLDSSILIERTEAGPPVRTQATSGHEQGRKAATAAAPAPQQQAAVGHGGPGPLWGARRHGAEAGDRRPAAFAASAAYR